MVALGALLVLMLVFGPASDPQEVIVPLCSSSTVRGDFSRLSLFEDGDLKFGGLFGGPRGPSPGVPASDLDLEFAGRLCECGGSSVGVSE